MSNLTVTERDSVLVVDSRLIAQDLGIVHKNLLETLDSYRSKIEAAFGVVRFETEKPLKGSRGGRPERVAYLSEDQATLLMTFSRNTPRVVDCKVALVQAFSKAKQIIGKAIPAQSPEAERMKLELELIRAKQHYQDTGHAIALSTSPAMLRWLRGDAPPPKEIEYRERFVDPATGREIGSTSGRSLTQLVADAGLNPKSSRDRTRVKKILKSCGFDYDKMQRWTSASYLREYPVLEEDVYQQALKTVLAEVTESESQPNLFVHSLQRSSFTPSSAPDYLEREP